VGETPADGGTRRETRRLLFRVLLVQALTLIALYVLQVRFGIGAG
jgi:hypothetical protein